MLTRKILPLSMLAALMLLTACASAPPSPYKAAPPSDMMQAPQEKSLLDEALESLQYPLGNMSTLPAKAKNTGSN